METSFWTTGWTSTAGGGPDAASVGCRHPAESAAIITISRPPRRKWERLTAMTPDARFVLMLVALPSSSRPAWPAGSAPEATRPRPAGRLSRSRGGACGAPSRAARSRRGARPADGRRSHRWRHGRPARLWARPRHAAHGPSYEAGRDRPTVARVGAKGGRDDAVSGELGYERLLLGGVARQERHAVTVRAERLGDRQPHSGAGAEDCDDGHSVFLLVDLGDAQRVDLAHRTPAA